MAAPRSFWRAFRHRFFVALGVTLVLALGGIVVGNRVVDSKLEDIPRVPDLVLSSAGSAEAANYLIVGSDTRAFVSNETEAEAFGTAQDQGGQRSDTLMVLHIDPAAKKGLLVSFPRDLLVDIPGQGRGQINSAFNDGPQKVIDTLKANFDLDVSHYVEVDFKAFVGLVDAIGKIPVYFPAPARDRYTGLDIAAAGCVPLDGNQALQYVRSRSLQYYDSDTGEWENASPRADLDRITRQQNFIRRLASAASVKAGANPLKALEIADALVPKLQVDTELSKSDIFRLVKTFRKVNPEEDGALEMLTLPVTTASDGNRLVAKQPDASQVIARLNSFGPQETGEDIKVLPSQVRVRVLNGSGVTGAAAGALADLQQYSFAPAGVGNADSAAVTELRYRPGDEDKARLVLRYLGGVGKLVSDSSIADADVVLVLGADFSGVAAPGGQPAATTTTAGSRSETSSTTKPAAGTAAPEASC